VSKIFETLSKGGGEIADAIRPLVDGGHEAAPPAPAGAEAAESPISLTNQVLDGLAPSTEPAPAQIRTLSLHVPAPSPLLPFEDDQWRASEQYRVLRTKIVQHPKQPRVMVISSAASGDGKSVSAINLAATLSLKSEARVLLVDADFRKSAIHVQLGLPATPGLADLLRGACSPEEALVNTRELPNLCVLCAGTPPVNPVELLDSSHWPALCVKLRNMFRYIVVDSPPVAAVADFDLIQAACDGVILVVRPDHTDRPLLQRSLEIVAKGKLLGVLLNCVPDWSLAKDSSADYYYYSKGRYSKDSAPHKADPPAPETR
jgi:capsular exopolysaccharide synthesis family protein